MSKTLLTHKTSLPVQLLCLLMAGLTACSTARPQNVWQEVTPVKSIGSSKPAEIQDSWGSKAESPNALDPAIAPGYLLTMHSLTDSKLNGDYRVEFNGDLALPYDLTLNTTGLTLSQIKSKLVDLYRPFFKTSSDIDLKVKERRFLVDVRGLVEKPGHYLVEAESSLDLVIGLAGGVSKADPPLYVRIQKGQKVYVFDLNTYYSQGEDHPQILGWLGGEVIFFQKELAGTVGERTSTSPYRLPIYMLGEVRKPGEYTLNPGSDFLDSLVLAGGFTERADLDNIEIIRRTTGRKRVYDFSWRDLQSAPTPVQGDVIFVHADNTTKFERHTTLIATIIAALTGIVTATVFVLAYNRGRI